MDRLDRVLLEENGERDLVAIALSARQIAELGDYCRCKKPSLRGGVRICGHCLLGLDPAPALPYDTQTRLSIARAVLDGRPVAEEVR